MIKKLSYYFLLTFLLLNFSNASVLELKEDSSYNLNDYLYYSYGKHNHETPKDLNNNIWKSNIHDINAFNLLNRPYWVKFSVENKSLAEKNFFIIMDSQFLFSLETYYLEKNTTVHKKIDGYVNIKKDRLKHSQSLVFPISIQKKQTIDVYMKINNFNVIIIPAKIVTGSELLQHNADFNLWQGAFFGLIIVMLFFNLILYFITKFKAYIFYVLYLLGVFFYFVIHQGYMNSFVFFNNMIFLTTSAFIIVVFLLLFVNELLSLHINLPKISKFFYYLIYTILFFYLGFNFFYLLEDYSLSHYFFAGFALLLPLYLVLISYSTYYLAYKGKPAAKYFAIVWSVLLISAIFSIILPYNGVFLYNYSVFTYLLQAAFAFEAIMFSIILGLRIKEIEADKEKQNEMIIHQNKLVSMGEMIHNIAHQWRQPLSVINATTWKLYLQHQNNELTDKEIEKNIDEIEEVTQYLSNTINDFMHFFHPDKEKEEFSINKSLNNTINILALSKENITVHITSDMDYSLRSFKSEFIQCIMIILNNSKEAILHNSIQNPEININISQKNGYIDISIRDNGGGIPLEIIDKIYDPYFTTKNKTEGTGLGLYISKMIIEKSMQGKILAQNQASGLHINISIPIEKIK